MRKHFKLEKIDHFMDQPHPNLIDIGYKESGWAEEPVIGEHFLMYSGKIGYLIFNSGIITEITETGFKTKNSEYKLTNYE